MERVRVKSFVLGTLGDKVKYNDCGKVRSRLKDSLSQTLNAELLIKSFYGKLKYQRYVGREVRFLPWEIHAILGYVNGKLESLNFYEISVEVDKYGMVLVRAGMTEPEDHEVILGYYNRESVLTEYKGKYFYEVIESLIGRFERRYGSVSLISINSEVGLTSGERGSKHYIGFAMKEVAGRDFRDASELAICVFV